MATVQAILTRKGSEVATIGLHESALDAATRMNQRGIGGLVVVDDGRVVGIVTERDILRRVVAARLDPGTTRVTSIMTTPVATCRVDTSLAECRTFMTAKRIRHLPVLDERGLCGIVTIGDLLAQEVDDQQATIGYLNSYIQGDVR